MFKKTKILIAAALLFSGCMADPFPCDDGYTPLDSGSCASEKMTSDEMNYADMITREMGGENYFYGTKIDFYGHEEMNALYISRFGKQHEKKVAGFNDLHGNHIHCVKNSLPHEMMHQRIWYETDGAMDGGSHQPDTGWTEADTMYVRMLLRVYGPLSRGEPPNYDVGI